MMVFWLMVSVGAVVQLARWAMYRLSGRRAGRCDPHIPPPPWPAQRVSFLVAGWNAAEELPAFLRAYVALSCPGRELVLAVGGGDGSFELAAAFQQDHPEANVRLCRQLPSMGKQGALRAAWPLVTGEIVFLTDVDCRLTDDAVARLVHHVAAGADAATGTIQPWREQLAVGFVRTQWAILRATHRANLRPATGLTGANTAVARTAIVQAGAFVWEAPSGTDYTLAKQLLAVGLTIWCDALSEMPTKFPDRFASYLGKQARWLKNVWVFGRRYHAEGDVRAVLATLAVPWVMLGLLVWGYWWVGAWGIGLALAGEAVGRRVYYLVRARQPLCLGAVAVSVVADWLAAGLACRQMLTHDWRWT